MEPVVQVIDESDGVWDVVTLWTEEQQHSKRKILQTTKHNIKHTYTWSDKHLAQQLFLSSSDFPDLLDLIKYAGIEVIQ